jgi:hypothetical protein
LLELQLLGDPPLRAAKNSFIMMACAMNLFHTICAGRSAVTGEV